MAALNKCQTYMSSYNSLNSVPTTASEFLMKKVLRGEWGFDGFVVSDWNAIGNLINHCYAANIKDAARLAFKAGVDMEMISTCYSSNVPALISEGALKMEDLDKAVGNVLRVKFRLDLFNTYYTDPKRQEICLDKAHLDAAKKAAV